MEKEPKIIGEDAGIDNAIPEFEKKVIESQEYSEEKLESKNEDDSISESVIEAQENLFLPGGWTTILQKHRSELPDDIMALLLKGSKKGGFKKHLTSDEFKYFFDFRDSFWLNKFGISFNDWHEKWRVYDQERLHKKHKLKNEWFDIVSEARAEFPLNIQEAIEKLGKGERIPHEKYVDFRIAINNWWRERFGQFIFTLNEEVKNKKTIKTSKVESRKENKAKELDKFEFQKKKKMESLHRSIQNLDNGEPVNEFRDDSRRVIFYDEENDGYYINERGARKYLGIGDILSDYAWGIKYVPDGEMIEPSYRIIAKRILVNEARRDLEKIYDEELSLQSTYQDPITKHQSIHQMEQSWKNPSSRMVFQGFVAEFESRELLSRMAINNDVPITVFRSNVKEDSVYKYDYKLRTVKRDRGVKVEEGELKEPGKVRKIGIQFTTRKSPGKKSDQIDKVKKKLGDMIPVDDILLVTVSTPEFADSFTRWLKAGKPSGGPEQFLSRDLKIRLLKEITRGLVEITDEEIEKIIPVEESGVSLKEQAA